MFGRFSFTALVLLAALMASARAERIKDLARVQGVRANQLVGYGLVVGLAQTGDDLNIPFTRQSLLALLRRMGTIMTDQPFILNRDTAAVLVTALVPPFARSGSQVDVHVAAVGNARSLQGGVLIATPLRGGDGRVYAVAQGPVVVGGLFNVGATGSFVQRNHVTTGRIPEGAVMERDVPGGLREDALTFLLRTPDFTTANRIARAIELSLAADQNAADGPPAKWVQALDAGTVHVTLPARLRGQAVALAARLEELEVEPAVPARVVVNERSGVVVIGEHVRLGRAAVSYGRLTVRVDEGFGVSQPNALGTGATVVTPQTRIEQNELPGQLREVGPAAKVEDVVRALNQLGASTRELVAILQALKLAGALRGELIIE
ncbi:MAG: flagellar basal body P-ring protein FlgI [Myxococcales bacterium]|nr:flagellar basal body P-ring protein FlgI [Myxococcota bacterium]MDW8283347.1 flagellar basal body P-ring protein FlgI [Myxococcales bacterium]